MAGVGVSAKRLRRLLKKCVIMYVCMGNAHTDIQKPYCAFHLQVTTRGRTFFLLVKYLIIGTSERIYKYITAQIISLSMHIKYTVWTQYCRTDSLIH